MVRFTIKGLASYIEGRYGIPYGKCLGFIMGMTPEWRDSALSGDQMTILHVANEMMLVP